MEEIRFVPSMSVREDDSLTPPWRSWFFMVVCEEASGPTLLNQVGLEVRVVPARVNWKPEPA
jgi:hypothetical protein